MAENEMKVSLFRQFLDKRYIIAIMIFFSEAKFFYILTNQLSTLQCLCICGFYVSFEVIICCRKGNYLLPSNSIQRCLAEQLMKVDDKILKVSCLTAYLLALYRENSCLNERKYRIY